MANPITRSDSRLVGSVATQGCRASSYASGYRKGIALPSLTLILPVWNRETELRREVDHLLEILPEFLASFELLIVDDGGKRIWRVAYVK